MTTRVAVCVSGRGSNLAALLEALEPDSAAAVVVVISNRTSAAALERARQRGIATHVLADAANPDEWLDVLRQQRVDLLVLAGFLALVPAEVVREYQNRALNIHPSLLPRHGGPGMYGRHVHAAVLAAGERESGATVHAVTEHFDDGPILGQLRVPVLPEDTPESLATRVLAAEHLLLPAAVLAAAQAGQVVPFTPPVAASLSEDR